MATSDKSELRRRIPAAERREALIEAAVHHFAHGGLRGTKVSQIAAEVGAPTGFERGMWLSETPNNDPTTTSSG